MVVLVLSVLPPSLSGVVCHVMQCVFRCWKIVLAGAGRCPPPLPSLSIAAHPSLSSLHHLSLISAAIDFRLLPSIVHLLYPAIIPQVTHPSHLHLQL